MEFDVIFCRVVRGAGVRNERNVVIGPQSTGQNLVPFVNSGVVAGKGDGPSCTFLGNRNRQWGELAESLLPVYFVISNTPL
jgi:hypothetical protein